MIAKLVVDNDELLLDRDATPARVQGALVDVSERRTESAIPLTHFRQNQRTL